MGVGIASRDPRLEALTMESSKKPFSPFNKYSRTENCYCIFLQTKVVTTSFKNILVVSSFHKHPLRTYYHA